MRLLIRVVGFSLMTMFASCGVGAQDVKNNSDISVKQHVPTAAHFDKSAKLDGITAVE
ncbi:hypothetical protein [Pseudomonas arsenicoxydans]|uniref:hypothetical protein n=1 Tax=Pseudomonas arsenicoxydans TaxID=702115 RepID=UPI001ABF105B|nr:hypothetical protein [Pseudomonas arsenicoxydans]